MQIGWALTRNVIENSDKLKCNQLIYTPYRNANQVYPVN